MATLTELTIYRGENKTWELLIRDSDRQPVDLTTAKLYFAVKPRYDDVTYAVLKRSLSAGGDATQIEILNQLVTATKGRARIYLLPADTNNLDPDMAYLCDAWIELASGARHPVIAPLPFKVKPTIVRF